MKRISAVLAGIVLAVSLPAAAAQAAPVHHAAPAVANCTNGGRYFQVYSNGDNDLMSSYLVFVPGSSHTNFEEFGSGADLQFEQCGTSDWLTWSSVDQDFDETTNSGVQGTFFTLATAQHGFLMKSSVFGKCIQDTNGVGRGGTCTYNNENQEMSWN